MARRKDGIIWHLMDAPWWLSVLLAVVIYLGLSYLLPSLAASSDNFIFNAMAPNLPLMAPYFTFLFLLPAPIAFFKQYKRKQSYLTTSSQIKVRKNTSPLNDLSWIEFESYIGEYFKFQGYEVKQSFSQKPDGGVDIWLTKEGELSLVQCKHWKARKVGVQVLREMYGVMIANNASKMIIVTSGDFTSEAIAFAVDKRLWLVNGSELVHMVEDGRSFLNKPVIPASEKVPAVEHRVCPSCQSKLVMSVAKWGLPEAPKRAPRGHYDKMVATFEADGIEGITKQDLANSKGRKLLESKLPVTPRMLPLLSWLVRKYPMVDMTLIFHSDVVDEAVLMLEEYNREHTEKLAA